jgi:histo-blood group ABO system transferase
MKRFSLRLLILLLSAHHVAAYKIGLSIMATGKYDAYAERLIESARTYFLKNHEVTYFVFTDGSMKESPDVVQIYQQRLGWPHDTLMRFAVYAKHEQLLAQMDYIFASDADMLFVAPVGDEILGTLVGTRYADFGQRGPYESNKKSVAYVAPDEGEHYFAGGFYGAQRDVFFAMVNYLSAQVMIDLEKNYIAVWHDESHLNRFFIDYKPTIALSPSYCYMESWNAPYERKLVALDKTNDMYAQRSVH